MGKVATILPDQCVYRPLNQADFFAEQWFKACRTLDPGSWKEIIEPDLRVVGRAKREQVQALEN